MVQFSQEHILDIFVFRFFDHKLVCFLSLIWCKYSYVHRSKENLWDGLLALFQLRTPYYILPGPGWALGRKQWDAPRQLVDWEHGRPRHQGQDVPVGAGKRSEHAQVCQWLQRTALRYRQVMYCISGGISYFDFVHLVKGWKAMSLLMRNWLKV